MRVAVISPGYAPDSGGVEEVVTATCEGLAARGSDVEVWTHGQADSVEVRGGVRVRRFRATRSNRFPVAPALWRHAHSTAADFDLLHAHSFHSAAAVGVLFAGPTIPVVFTPHYHGGGHTRLAELLHVPYRPVASRIFDRADAVVAVSRPERMKLAADRPTTANRLVTVRNGIDLRAIQAATAFEAVPTTILVLGRLERYKRVDRVIEAFEPGPTACQLIVVGDGPDRGRLSELAARSAHASRIRLLGRLARADVNRWLRTAHCVVSMSEHEAFGLVGLEAVGAGAQALLSDIPAHREVVELAGDDRCRLIEPAELPAAMAQAVGRPRGVPRAVRDWSAVVDETLVIYEQALR